MMMDWKGLRSGRGIIVRRYSGIILDGLRKPTKNLSG
jgi:hypothetical protein